MRTFRNKDGKKMYPICSWENNQHKLYNAHDRIMNDWYEDKCGYGEVEKIEKALAIFEENVVNGIVYATWADGQIVKEYIFSHDARR